MQMPLGIPPPFHASEIIHPLQRRGGAEMVRPERPKTHGSQRQVYDGASR